MIDSPSTQPLAVLSVSGSDTSTQPINTRYLHEQLGEPEPRSKREERLHAWAHKYALKRAPKAWIALEEGQLLAAKYEFEVFLQTTYGIAWWSRWRIKRWIEMICR